MPTTDKLKSLYKNLSLARGRQSGVGPALDDGPLVVAGMFQTANGLGRAAKYCVESLEAAGLEPFAVDLSGALDQLDIDSGLILNDMPRSQRGTLILFVNAPETQYALKVLGLRRWHRWRIIGSWAWELPILPKAWAGPARHLSEIWVPSTFVAEAARQIVDVPVRVVNHTLPAIDRTLAPSTRRSDRSLNCITLADGRSSFHRKNVIAATEIFQHGLRSEQQASLTIKCRNLSEFPQFERQLNSISDADRRVRIEDRSLPDDAYYALLASADLLISAHRSEGFGLALAEAMSIGIPVMATAWSGNLEFMTPETAALIDFTLEPVSDPFGIYSKFEDCNWARIDIAHGVAGLRRLAGDASHRIALGERGRRHVAALLDGRQYLSALGVLGSG